MTRRKTLTTQVADALAERIHAGTLAPGSRLPTEAELCAEFDVSRTVVREAVARLRSGGLVTAQQGRGVFVNETPSPQSFLISEDDLRSLPETIALLELRLSIEVEAAALCAERRTDDEAREIRALMEQVDARHPDPKAVKIHYDYDFHIRIAQCARNDFMAGFLEYLRPFIVPRFNLGQFVSPETKDAYYRKIHAEHDAIVAAIDNRDPDAARDEMRQHLTNSLERLRILAAQNAGAAQGSAGPLDTTQLLAGLAGRSKSGNQ